MDCQHREIDRSNEAMKSFAYLVLFSSLLANFSLGRALWQLQCDSNLDVSSLQVSEGNHHVEAAEPTHTQPRQRNLWQRMGSTDLSLLVANLRTAGLPPQQIARIINNLIAEKYAPKFDSVFSGKSDTPYWRSPNGYYYDQLSKTGREQQHRLWEEQRSEEMKLLGNDYWLIEEAPYVDFVRRQHGNLSPEKLSAIQALQLEYSSMSGSLESIGSNLRSSSDTEKLKLLEKEFRNDLAKILTPEELSEHDLRSGNAAQLLQLRCNFFAATEAEYRTLFPIYQQIDQAAPYSDWDEVDEKTRTARKDAETRAQAQIGTTLGPARYAEFKQANDKNATKENQLVTRLGLPLSAAAQLVSVRTEFTNRAELIRKDKALPDNERATQLAALKTEAESRLTATLGHQRLAAYQQHAGSWLSKIAPPSPNFSP